MVNRILNITLVTKITKKLDLYAYSFKKWVYIKGKTKCMYFMINNGKIFDKYMTISEKVNIMKNKEYSEKKDNSEMIYSKIYLKAEKRFNTKESFQCFYIPVILLDWV